MLPNISWFGHQACEGSYFDSLGFTSHLADNPGLAGYNVVISNDGGGPIEATNVPDRRLSACSVWLRLLITCRRKLA